MTDKAKLIELAIQANRIVGATNDAAIESGFTPDLNAIHESALQLQARTQRAIAKAAGWLVGDDPAYNAPPLAWILYNAEATESDLTEMLGRFNWSRPLGGDATQMESIKCAID